MITLNKFDINSPGENRAIINYDHSGIFSSPERRGSRTACIGGLVYENNQGAFYQDNEFLIEMISTIDDYKLIKSWFENQTQLIFSCDFGLFIGIVKNFSLSNSRLTIIFLPVDKISDEILYDYELQIICEIDSMNDLSGEGPGNSSTYNGSISENCISEYNGNYCKYISINIDPLSYWFGGQRFIQTHSANEHIFIMRNGIGFDGNIIENKTSLPGEDFYTYTYGTYGGDYTFEIISTTNDIFDFEINISFSGS